MPILGLLSSLSIGEPDIISIALADGLITQEDYRSYIEDAVITAGLRHFLETGTAL